MTRRPLLVVVVAALLVVVSVGVASAEWLSTGSGDGNATAGTWDTTVAPSPEVCDGVDNDLNGVVDDEPVDVPPDDGVDATVDVCDDGVWTMVIASGFCVIDGVSYVEDALNPGDPGLACLPDLSKTGWSPVP